MLRPVLNIFGLDGIFYAISLHLRGMLQPFAESVDASFNSILNHLRLQLQPPVDWRSTPSICRSTPLISFLVDFRSSNGVVRHFLFLHAVFKLPSFIKRLLRWIVGDCSCFSSSSSSSPSSSSSSSSCSSPRSRYRVLLPSNAVCIGAFAADCLPAGASYATPKQKRRIRQIGAQTGCHTCGRRRVAKKSPTAATANAAASTFTATVNAAASGFPISSKAADEEVEFYADHQPPLAKSNLIAPTTHW